MKKIRQIKKKGIYFKSLDHNDKEDLSLFFNQILLDNFTNPNTTESFEVILSYLLDNKLKKNSSKKYYVTLSYLDQKLIGGAIFAYLANINYGFLEYIVIAKLERRKGFASILHKYIENQLIKEAKQNSYPFLNGIFAEVDTSIKSIRNAKKVYRALNLLRKLGYFYVNINYIQPQLDANKDIVDYLSLFLKPNKPKKFILSKILFNALFEYFIWFSDSSKTKVDNILDKMLYNIKEGSIGLIKINKLISNLKREKNYL